MNDFSDLAKSAAMQDRLRLGVLLCLYVATCCLSLVYVAGPYSTVVVFDRPHLLAGLLCVASFSLVAIVFAIARFSFGYFLGFYLFTVALGYIWLIQFSKLSYDHPLAIVSIFLSALAFLAPAAFITSPIRHRFFLSERHFHALLYLIVAVATATVAVGALYNFKLANFTDMYKFRAGLQFPALLRYSIGITVGALLPFAFACFIERRSPWLAGLTLLLIVLLYPVTLTKLTLFMPVWLLFLLFLSKCFEARIAAVLSLLVPTFVGVAWIFVSQHSGLMFQPMQQFVTIVNDRMIAMPSIALEVYNNFFSTHALTHFCQINILKPLVACPYDQPLSVIMNSAYIFGNFNASLFATEGVASVGLALAPLSALVCGLVIGFSNRLSSELPPRFILLSSGVLPQLFMNVPFSTTLLSNGAVVLFLLWAITPRSVFREKSAWSPEGREA